MYESAKTSMPEGTARCNTADGSGGEGRIYQIAPDGLVITNGVILSAWQIASMQRSA